MTLKTTWANGDQFQASDMNDVATAVNSNYSKPGTGIPATDLASAVQTSLAKADSAVQAVSSTSISDSTSTGRGLITAADASAARTAIGVAYGNSAGTVCEGNDARLTPSSTSLSDATTVGKALLTATDSAAARTTLGVAYGSTTGTVVQGGGALGTPSGGTLTNCTGLPVAGLVASTSTAVGVGSVELGHATDTTLTRSAAGVLAVEGVDVVNLSSAQTLTGKRITPRIGTVASSATPSIDVGLYDQFNITALAAAITSMTSGLSGTPTDGQKLLIRIKDNGTARAIAWGTSFLASGAAALPTTTVISKTHLVGFIYDGVATKWICVAADAAGY